MQEGLGLEDINIWEGIRTEFESDAHVTMAAFRAAIESAEAAADTEVQKAKDALDRAPIRSAERAEDDYVDTLAYWTQPLRLLRSMALVALCAHLERARCRWEREAKWQSKIHANASGLPDADGYGGRAAIEGMRAARNQIVHQAGYVDVPLPPITTEGETAPAPLPARPDRVPPEYKSADGAEIDVADEILERDLKAAVACVQWYSEQARQKELDARKAEDRSG